MTEEKNPQEEQEPQGAEPEETVSPDSENSLHDFVESSESIQPDLEASSDAAPEGSSDQRQSENPKKILDVLDEQAGVAPERAPETPQPTEESSDDSAEIPLPPGAEELPAGTEETPSEEPGSDIPAPEIDEAEEMSLDAASSPADNLIEQPDEVEQPAQPVVPIDSQIAIDPELMISEAMKRLDKILDDIKDTEAENLAAKDQPVPSEEDSTEPQENKDNSAEI